LRGRHLRRFSELVVTDSGPSLRGLPVEVLFEPTWVTAPGRPTGLGLFALRTLVAAARGHFAIESPAETGARFVVRLPELEEEILGPELTAEESGKPTILLVEDDDGVRVLLHNALAKRGYRVIEARNGEEALMQSEICEANIDLLITDVVMPKMNGPTLARELIQTRPNTKMLLISGAPDDVGDVQELVKLGAHFMLKPFSQRELANRVDAVLNDQA
jgi:CheY-like chemotaxis protein